MFTELGRVIRERREALGLDQAALAALLDIGQQAVSGWERGRSRPRRAMLTHLAKVLSADENAFIDAGGYRSSASTVRSPLQPLTRALPMDELPEDRFEDFIADVMASMFPDGHASRFGGRGHKQYGIDILVTESGRNLATGQCKRHREFGPTAVRKAIGEVTVAAGKNYLFLSRLIATPDARLAAAEHSDWELWDGEDISRYVRNLPSDRAVRIVDTYFPGHRESFLGVASPSPWLPPEEHFDASRSTMFNHEWTLSGRREELDALVAAAYQPSANLVFLVGAGGVGKTRMLKALADAAPSQLYPVRVLPGDAQVAGADFERLPHQGGLTLIIDDAHELTGIASVVAGIWRHNRDAKIVLATRPYGLRSLRDGLARAGLLPADRKVVELRELSFEDAATLAREALGDDVSETVARRLAVLTADSPLATVIGGILISRGQLDPGALEQDDNVRDQIMRGFRDALVKDPLADDPPTRDAVLDAVAALQPVRTNDASARDSLSKIVGKPYDELHKHLRSLENAGILRRRGESLRIVPDLLGDVILADAAFGESDVHGTGYLARIEPLADGTSAEHLFVNVNRVDWQVRNKRPEAPSLADSLWAVFQKRIEDADLIGRRDLVGLLAKVAYFQPERALVLTRWLIDNPTEHIGDGNAVWRGHVSPGYTEVLHALAPALKFAALSLDTLPDALGQLWELACIDERPTNQHPQHAVRILRELAELDRAKPIAFNSRIVDIVSTWFAEGLRISPFEVLEPLLATEGDESSSHGHTITFRPYSLNPSSVIQVRKQVIDLAFDELSSTDLGRAGAAVRFLKSALHYPVGTFGRPVSTDERQGWTPGFVDTIERLGATAAKGALDPAVLVAIRDALFWHENYSDSATRTAAEHAVQSLPRGVESLLALVVHDGWGHLLRDPDDDYQVMEAKRLELMKEVVTGLSLYTDGQIVELLVARLRSDHEVNRPTVGQPGPVVASLIQARQGLAHALLEHIRTTAWPADLDPVLPVVLASLAEDDPRAALDAARDLLAGGPVERRRAVAEALSWNRGTREPRTEEIDLLLQLASDPDQGIRRCVARAAQMLASGHTGEVTRLIAAVRFADSGDLAEDIFMCFRSQLGISWSDFSEGQLEVIRKDLLALADIGGYSVSEALATRSASEPEWVIRLMQARVERAEKLKCLDGYRATPFHWDNRLRIRETAGLVASLNGILVWIADGLDSWIRRRMGAEVFAAVAVSYDSHVADVLSTALAFGSEEMTRAVSAVLHEAPRTFIWDQPDFVRTALHAAQRLGEKVRCEMTGALWSATVSGLRSGTPGEPYPETIEQRDRSRRMAEHLPAGSLEERFYSEMAKSAERDIAYELAEDAPDDGREW
ncbi:ATP-binding protein [Arthrobacter bambusae]|uniref:ATP-binding protein n=1 Tax=Arthrobacter bambusae TaxID=1338426 RepID=UPI002780E83A|nr:ATP-binding protein [Arthrobacter bambusae]MDQ0029040.1 transcriptional regulator with XRE-family HTH domain/DNA-binding transcriptional ArsR family regulator [Arthrobacter bambusae]MDQ0098558.1 transcriptional regulator with XRE-family HTH domain/DNA-binding transcriptional ArsR family regulator [Arthrobacter bambusae]